MPRRSHSANSGRTPLRSAPAPDNPALSKAVNDLRPDASPARQWALGEALAPLADEGVLIVGSGSLTHNLHEVRFDAADAAGEDYALEFSAWITQAVLNRDHARLQQTMAIAPHAQRAHPTPEHLWPLMVAAGAAGAEVPATRIEGGITHGVLAMDSYLFGTLPLPASVAADALAA